MVHRSACVSGMVRGVQAFVIAIAALVIVDPAQATPILVTFSGSFYDVDFGAAAAIPFGTTYTASIRYDSSTPGPVNFVPGPSDFFTAQVGPYSLHGTPTSYVVGPSGQFFQVVADVVPGSIPLTDPVTMTLTISLLSGFFFDSNHLPSSFVGLPALDRFFTVQGSGTAERAIATLSEITATPVPEPSSLLALGTALVILAGAGRRVQTRARSGIDSEPQRSPRASRA